MVAAAALALAWLIDSRFGEPRSAWHPVAWFGRIAAPLGRRVHSRAAPAAFAAGAVLWCSLVAAVAGAAFAVEQAAGAAPAWIAIPLLAAALKPTFAWRMLSDEVRAVEVALGQGLEQGQARVARLCSRDVTQLDAAAVRETAIESLAENFNDSLVAPLFWFLVAGLPGAWTGAPPIRRCDVGYRGPWEWAGKWAARADDVLGCVPARLAALLLWRPSVGVARLTREAALTPSPNGGWPMAAMAFRIGVRLGKQDAYALNAQALAPDAAALTNALTVGEGAARGAIAAALLLVVLKVNVW